MVIRSTTLLLLLAAILFPSIACNFDVAEQKPEGPPVYALLRLRHPATRIEMLTIMETFGEGTCEVALREFTRAIYENETDMEGWKETERDCREDLTPLHQRIFNDERVHATYLKITVRENWDYESRMVLYGIPSSQAQEVCQEIGRELERQLQARTECVQGTEG